jgi:hypothetical protein
LEEVRMRRVIFSVKRAGGLEYKSSISTVRTWVPAKGVLTVQHPYKTSTTQTEFRLDRVLFSVNSD